MRETEITKLLECYQADLENFNFTRVKESVPTGVLRFEFQKELSGSYYGKGVSTWELGINIYPFFEKSSAYFKELCYSMDQLINVEFIDRIYIINQNSESYREIQELQKTHA